MAFATTKRARLMLSCGGAALALSLSLPCMTSTARAQAFQASESVEAGGAVRIPTGPNSELIEVFTETAVIDWTPDEDAAGNALDFLPTGATATFTGSANNPGSDFAVLNRILPSRNGNVVVFDGTVISRIFDAIGNEVTGGTVAFYSPTGILVGGNASFDVGNLILTTLEPDLASFDDFAINGGTLSLNGANSPTARIQIDPGARITATAENSYFAAIAANIAMRGTSNINGSQAYIAGEVVNLTFSNGLFDIEVPVGTAVSGTVMELNGDVGGPSSTGAGDNHMIYSVARASNDPIRMLFSGNLGFQPAANASIINGEIILSANGDVFGRDVRGGSIADGANAVFGATPDPLAAPPTEADIVLDGFASSSSLLAIGTHSVSAVTSAGPNSVEGNLLLVGSERAELSSRSSFDVSGDVLVSSRAFGAVSASVPDPTLLDAIGGLVEVFAFESGIISIAGNAIFTADALGGYDTANLRLGEATGGEVSVSSEGAAIVIDGTLNASARGIAFSDFTPNSPLTGAPVTGGDVFLSATFGGFFGVGDTVTLAADAVAVASDLGIASTGSPANGGNISIQSSFGTIEFGGDLLASTNATAGGSRDASPAADAFAGQNTIQISDSGTLSISGDLTFTSDAVGALNNGDGSGGIGGGGGAQITLSDGGSFQVGGDASLSARGTGGRGNSGGNADGGSIGIDLTGGTTEFQGDLSVDSSARGGDGTISFGGAGGIAIGGVAQVRAAGTANDPGSFTIGGAIDAFANGTGGTGGAGDATTPPGEGGDARGGRATVFIESGMQAIFGSTLDVQSVGRGGGASAAGLGGDGFGGSSQVDGGAGVVVIGAGTELRIVDDIRVAADGFGLNGGDGTGGDAFSSAEDGGRLEAEALFSISARGTGGNAVGNAEPGGRGFGGQASITAFQDSTIDVGGNLFVSGSATGGSGSTGGDATGGLAEVTGRDGTGLISVTAQSTVEANGRGGLGTIRGGDGTGGISAVIALGGNIALANRLSILAQGLGGNGFLGTGDGGDGTGGAALAFASQDDGGNGGNLAGADLFVSATGTGGRGSNGLAGADGRDGGIGRGGTQINDNLLSGGAAAVAHSGATMQFGSTTIEAEGAGGQGGSGGAGAGGGAGGDAFGGTATAGGTNAIADTGQGATPDPTPQPGGTILHTQLLMSARADGGFRGTGSPEGIGGSAEGGQTVLNVIPDTLVTVDRLRMDVVGGGEDGSSGGRGTAGTATLGVLGAMVVNQQIDIVASGVGNSASDPSGTSGEGIGGNVDIFTDGAGSLAIVAALNAQAEASAGVGSMPGSATGGTISIAARGGSITARSLSLSTRATAQGATAGSGGNGGNATGGAITVSAGSLANDGSLTAISSLSAESSAGAGDGDGAGVGGAATGGQIRIFADSDRGTLVSAFTALRATATAGDGESDGNGAATGGSILAGTLSNPNATGATALAGRADFGDLSIAVDGRGGQSVAANGGNGIGGDGQLLAEGGMVELANLQFNGDGIAGNALGRGEGGTLAVRTAPHRGNGSLNGTITATGDLFGAARVLGDEAISAGGSFLIEAAASDILANGIAMLFYDAATDSGFNSSLTTNSLISATEGSITVADSIDARSIGELVVAQQGPNSVTANNTASLETPGLLRIQGDVGVSLEAAFVETFSGNIEIEPGARIDGEDITLTSTNQGAPAVIGGAAPGFGYSLLQEELERISGTSLAIFLPDIAVAGFDAEVFDVTLNGSASGNFVNVSINSGGSLGVLGDVLLQGADVDDSIGLLALDYLQVVLPGGSVAVRDAASAPTGRVFLTAPRIIAASNALGAQILADPSDPAIITALADDGGATVPRLRMH